MSDDLEYIEPIKPPTLVNAWPVGLVEEISLNEMSVGAKILDDADLCRQFDITQAQLDHFRGHIGFKAQVREAIASVKDSNATLKRKARMSLEYYADTYIPQWLSDPSASVDSKTKLLQFLAKIGGIDAAEKAAEAAAMAEVNKSSVGQSNQPQIIIQLTQAPQQAPITLQAEQVIENVRTT